MTQNSQPSIPFELALLARAVEYQRWIADTVRPYLGARILEVGAGVGNLSCHLPLQELLYVSETDPQLFDLLKENVQACFGEDPRIIVGAVDLTRSLSVELTNLQFDTVVSFNVLEHIQDDAAALANLVELLDRGKRASKLRIISLVPAHQWAYGSMDREYGHFRRYSRHDFSALARRIAPGWNCTTRYFNAVGLPGWILMGRLLRRAKIDPLSVDLFDRICPYIRALDDFSHVKLGLPFGQSLLAVISRDRNEP